MYHVFVWFLIVFLFLLCLGLYRKLYSRDYDGNVIITVNPDGKKKVSLELDFPLDDLDKKDVIIFKVREVKHSTTFEDDI